MSNVTRYKRLCLNNSVPGARQREMTFFDADTDGVSITREGYTVRIEGGPYVLEVPWFACRYGVPMDDPEPEVPAKRGGK